MKHVTCTYKVTGAASIMINTFLTYTVHVESTTVECVYIHAHMKYIHAYMMNLHAWRPKS